MSTLLAREVHAESGRQCYPQYPVHGQAVHATAPLAQSHGRLSPTMSPPATGETLGGSKAIQANGLDSA